MFVVGLFSWLYMEYLFCAEMYFDRRYQHFVRTSWLFRIEDKEVGFSKLSYLATKLHGIISDKMKIVRVGTVVIPKSYSTTQSYHLYSLPRALYSRAQGTFTSVHIIVPSESMAMQHTYEILIRTSEVQRLLDKVRRRQNDNIKMELA